MRKSLGICLLILLLTVPTVAGEMPNDRPAPPPQPTSAVQEPTLDGIMSNDTPDSLTQIALDLLAVLPTLL
jgi:hypothetical protein